MKIRKNIRKKIILLLILFVVAILLCCLIYVFFSFIKSGQKGQLNNNVISANNVVSVEEKEPIKSSYKKDVEIYFLDVGHGDAALILYKDYSVLIDIGSGDAKEALVELLEEQEIDKIDYLFLTHGHEDHMGNGVGLLTNYQYDETLKGRIQLTIEHVVADMRNEEGYVVDFMTVAKNMEIETIIPKTGQEFSLDELKITVLMAPDIDMPKSDAEIEIVNNQSLAILVEFEENTILVYGDGGGIYEEVLLEKLNNLKVDILKVSHHGGSEASSEKMLKKLMPRYAVISSAKQEVEGFPTDEILERYALMQIPLFCTNKLGTIKFVSDGKNIKISTEQKQEEY